MATTTAQRRSYSDTEPFPVDYKSTILEQFVEWIEPWKDAQILDAGPVCQENISFFARRMSRHYACDMFIRLHRALAKQPGSIDFCKHLDYPPHLFDGVQLWDLIDHLDDDQAGQLVKRCFEMLRSTGLLMLIALEKKPDPASINSFVIGRDFRVKLRLQQHLQLPWYCRHNRALISLLSGFDFVKSFRYRNGLREFLFQKPGLVRE